MFEVEAQSDCDIAVRHIAEQHFYLFRIAEDAQKRRLLSKDIL